MNDTPTSLLFKLLKPIGKVNQQSELLAFRGGFEAFMF
jgi:hypothetical protein